MLFVWQPQINWVCQKFKSLPLKRYKYPQITTLIWAQIEGLQKFDKKMYTTNQNRVKMPQLTPSNFLISSLYTNILFTQSLPCCPKNFIWPFSICTFFPWRPLPCCFQNRSCFHCSYYKQKNCCVFKWKVWHFHLALFWFHTSCLISNHWFKIEIGCHRHFL